MKKPESKVYEYKKWTKKKTELILNSCYEAIIKFNGRVTIHYKRANMLISCNTDCFDIYPYTNKPEKQDCYCEFYKDINCIIVLR